MTETEQAIRDKVIRECIILAKGCKDYGGGYRSNDGELAIYHHGMDTVVNVLEAHLRASDRKDTQVNAVFAAGMAQ